MKRQTERETRRGRQKDKQGGEADGNINKKAEADGKINKEKQTER